MPSHTNDTTHPAATDFIGQLVMDYCQRIPAFLADEAVTVHVFPLPPMPCEWTLEEVYRSMTALELSGQLDDWKVVMRLGSGRELSSPILICTRERHP
jgi:hypothetical protein